jgi:hypothetical protein
MTDDAAAPEWATAAADLSETRKETAHARR